MAENVETNVTVGGEKEHPTLKTQLEKDVRLNVFVIGVGNAGNQTVVYGKKEGLNVFAINSSIKDLSDQVVDESIPSFIIGKEARGAGKNIEKGLELFKKNGKELFQVDAFMSSCQAADVIVVVSATGGGTGSSVSPEICRTLQKIFPKKIIIYYGIAPKNSDSNISFNNSLYCLNEIKNLNIPYGIADLNWYADEPNDEAFIKADKYVVECIKSIAGMYLNLSSSEMIDENDLKSIISEPGYIAVYQAKNITSTALEKKSMQTMIIDEIKKGPAMMIQKDGISAQMGVIINCPDDLSEVTRSGNYEEIFNFIGHKPKKGIYPNYATTNGTSGQMIVILSGMTYPINRINDYIDSIKEQNEFLKKTKEIDISEDVEMVSSLLSNSKEKLSDDTTASKKEIDNVLDSIFG